MPFKLKKCHTCVADPNECPKSMPTMPPVS